MLKRLSWLTSKKLFKLGGSVNARIAVARNVAELPKTDIALLSDKIVSCFLSIHS